eukprot:TRINITY_DN12547_c0_g1_i1.p1 TRINITY_DN12547_c0_g1~~TRINITY_DN12547_c0_g1_i1.p1  ORF type:complete len:987 (+),score=314.53 TRINITY_DN12547_c0_g1_i1:80-2962(+)
MQGSPAAKRHRQHLPLTGEPEEAPVPLLSIACIAAEGDNCAVASRDLPRGTTYTWGGRAAVLSHHCLEGHRFVLEPTPAGGRLLSWGLPFGTASRALAPGTYLMNDLMLRALKGRRGLGFDLPTETNFVDADSSIHGKYELDAARFKPGEQVPVDPDAAGQTWMGYARPGRRGVGTRNAVVLVGLTVHAAGFTRALEARLQAWLAQHAAAFPSVSCVCGVAHNEGGAAAQNNHALIMRAISGFMVHPNVGAVLVIAAPPSQSPTVTLDHLRDHTAASPAAYPVDSVAHAYFTLSSDWGADMERAAGLVTTELLPAAAKFSRSPQPMSALRIAQQCGGSDSFSGISGNPLTGEVSEMLIRKGGLALISETPELVGAESYMLDNCKDVDTARRFLETIHRYQAYAARHGQDAAGNPSGGNLFRGLYNIALKSLGASRKKTPRLRLDRIVEYGERFAPDEKGYLFMDSPGNDLEAIAGQVACGCNVIIFITGNGSITNFPFVPTLKFVTTTRRFNVLSKDMDVNAGRLVDGESMEALSREVFQQMIGICSGTPCRGELAKHAQVSIWRNWALGEGKSVADLEGLAPNHSQRALGCEPLPVRGPDSGAAVTELGEDLDGWVANTASGGRLRRANLVLATSLCSGQPARLAAERLDAAQRQAGRGLLRFAHLPNTEGCGGTPFETLMARVLVGHLTHPLVRSAFVLEHGCEKTHNDWVRGHLAQRGLEEAAAGFGWGSCQGDGGVAAVVDKVASYFEAGDRMLPAPAAAPLPLVLGLLCADPTPAEDDLRGLAALVSYVVRRGGTVILPKPSPVLSGAAFCADAFVDTTPGGLIPPTIAFAEVPRVPGLHVMDVPSTMSWTEAVTGLAAAGCGCLLTWLGRGEGGLRPGHPFVPTVHAAVRDGAPPAPADADVVLSAHDAASARTFVATLMAAVAAAVTGETETKCFSSGAVDYSIPRELQAISL